MYVPKFMLFWVHANTMETLIERFANGTSLDDFLESLNNIYRDADQDPVLKGWFKHLDSYIRYVHPFLGGRR